ncbi:MAG: hypothetical protein M3Q07_06260, partial [Pseudobdellovibrionaceae bacterium]|nr:hypothetical protein [Pseudobdellovibrionaceae bacterium]
MFRLGLWLTLTLLLLNPKAGRGNPDLSQLIAVGEHRLLDDPSAALRYNLDLLQKTPKDDPDVWLHIAVNVMASYAYLERTDEADALLASIEQQLPRAQTPRWKIQILLQKAAILSFQQKAAEAIQLIDEAIVLSQTSELPLLEARARSHMALLQARTNNKTAAIEQLAQSIRLLRGTEKGVIYFVAMNQIATSFLVLEGHNLSKAVDILNELKAEAQARGLRFLAHLAAYNLGDVHAELLNEDASIQNFEQAAAYAEAIHDDLSQAYAQLGLVDAYRNRGQLDKARQVLLHAAATFEAHGNKSQAFEVHKNLVTLAMDQKKHELAWMHLQAIDQLGLDPKQIGAYSDLNLLRSRYYESLGDTGLALKSLQDHMRAAFRESSQLEHEAAQKFAAQFELERKEQQNILLAQKNEIQQLTIRQNERDATIKTLIILSSCLLLLIVSVAFLRIRKKNREIHRLNQHIKTDVLQRFLPPQMVDDILEGRSS